MSFEKTSHEAHAKHFSEYLSNENDMKISKTWFDETTADYWRHSRAYECCDCLTNQSNSSWLTVGDGRWGLDAIRIQKKGFINVLPTDISEPLLKESKNRGYIQKYSIENAEHLTFGDESFDYVFCKESFHHFPRPYLALYEMFRVARRAVFLVEPNDVATADSSIPLSYLVPLLKNILKSFIKNRGIPLPRTPPITFYPPSWEDVGNYVYNISRREAEKIALGLNFPQLVIKGLNDHYVKGCEFEIADVNKSAIFREIVERVNYLNSACKQGKTDYSVLMIGFLKEPLDPQTKDLFLQKGWDVIDLPRNPYLK